MAFGFPAYHTESYSAGAGQMFDLHAVVRAVLNSLKWTIREETDIQIVASTGVNFRSWGEKFLIRFLPDGTLSITSKCALPTQCLDWGKNKANVLKFIDAMKKQA